MAFQKLLAVLVAPSVQCATDVSIVLIQQRAEVERANCEICPNLPQPLTVKCGLPVCSGCEVCDGVETSACAPFCANVPSANMCNIAPCAECDACLTAAPTAAPTVAPTTAAPTAAPT